jgi:TnpA family transposase
LRAAWDLDQLFDLGIASCRIDADGSLHMPRVRAAATTTSAQQLAEAIESRLPERHLLDVLCNVDAWTQWTRHFGPLSGESAQIKDPRRRYVEAAFTYGCNLGPTQAARHLAGHPSPHMLSFVNRRHVDPRKLRAASSDIIDAYAAFDLQRLWGSGVRAAADGTHIPIYDDNPFAAYHWRFRGMAGVAYRHVADSYIAIFSRFIPCGVAEAAYILDGLLKNSSKVKPRILHSDTRGQTAAAFALAYLLGIELRPRIKNWRELVFYKPYDSSHYRHIGALFKGAVNWKLIGHHFADYIQVGASVQTGTLSSSWLLTRLNSTCHRNSLFRAFHELGRVIRTIHMLEVLTEPDRLRPGGSPQNKVEAFHRFSKWLLFGGQGVLRSNDPVEYEKAVHYNELVANAVMLQTVADQTQAVRQLIEEGYPVRAEDLERLSPYATQHLKRFGQYASDFIPPESRPPTSLPL